MRKRCSAGLVVKFRLASMPPPPRFRREDRLALSWRTLALSCELAWLSVCWREAERALASRELSSPFTDSSWLAIWSR
jgi:hypothetical protein